MSYIQADSTVSLLKNVPLDNTYKNTVLFNSEEEQANTFAGYVKFYKSDSTFQNVGQNWCILPYNAGDIYDCNYLRFKNKPTSNKWFYAFITEIEWVSNEASKIYYEIDVIQTWMFDFKLRPCFVERHHISKANDTIGANIIPEPLQFSEYHFTSIALNSLDRLNHGVWYLVGMKEWKSSATSPPPVGISVVQGCATGLVLYGFKNTSEFEEFYESLTPEDKKNIAFMTTAPEGFFERSSGWGYLDSVYNKDVKPKIKKVPVSMIKTILDGYTPVNAKCYTMPYNFLRIRSGTEICDYGLEHNRNTEDFIFAQHYSISATPSTTLYPVSYDDREKTVTCDSYPNVAYTDDNVSILNKVGSIINQSNLISAVVAGRGNVGATIGSVGATLLGNYVSNETREITSTNSVSNSSGNLSRIVNDSYGDFSAYHFQLKGNTLRSLDNFFTRFGYQINRITSPNRNTRSSFNYVKTNGCSVYGSVPAQDMNKINQIHDSGVTYWHSMANVGDYSIANN